MLAWNPQDESLDSLELHVKVDGTPAEYVLIYEDEHGVDVESRFTRQDEVATLIKKIGMRGQYNG